MATLFLIRHGEPELRGVFLGQLDSPLSVTGHEQIRTALSGLRVEIAYTSPLLRARQTAEYIPTPQPIECSELRELDQGEWTGLTWKDIETRWPDLASKRAADWLGVPAPGGETWLALVQRVSSVWDMIRKGPQPCAVVAHQGVNAALASIVCSADPLRFEQQYGEVIRLEYS